MVVSAAFKHRPDLNGIQTDGAVGQTHLDLTITVPPAMTVRDSHAVEQRVRDAILQARRDIREVKIHVHGQEQGEDLMDRLKAEHEHDQERNAGSKSKKVIKSDFGEHGC